MELGQSAGERADVGTDVQRSDRAVDERAEKRAHQIGVVAKRLVDGKAGARIARAVDLHPAAGDVVDRLGTVPDLFAHHIREDRRPVGEHHRRLGDAAGGVGTVSSHLDEATPVVAVVAGDRLGHRNSLWRNAELTSTVTLRSGWEVYPRHQGGRKATPVAGGHRRGYLQMPLTLNGSGTISSKAARATASSGLQAPTSQKWYPR